ncbi:MAG: zinc finger HIT domain-containing protein [Methanosarcina sp.]
MEVSGLCAICGRPAKLYTCPLCGKTVCSQCMNHKKHICIRCAHGRTGAVLRSKDGYFNN